MDKTYFFDTYSLIELLNGSESYAGFRNCTILTSKLNLMEIYTFFIKKGEKQKADFYFDKFLVNCEEIPDSVLKLAVIFRRRFNSQVPKPKFTVSFVDAIGYVFARHLKIKFLTGDDAFKNLPNVEFVK